MSHNRVWSSIHPDAPTTDDGVPIHPEKGYPICAKEKTGAETERDDIPYCLQSGGWGTDRTTGHCKNHGGAGGAPTGWANGNARHLMYSKRMNDDDAETFRKLIDVGDGEHVPLDEFRKTLSNMIAFEEMRLSRAIGLHPDVDQIAMFECPRCGKSYRRSVDGDGDTATVDVCTGDVRVGPETFEPCEYGGGLERVPGKAWVDFGDDAVERKQAHIANLIRILDQMAGTKSIDVDADVAHSGDEPLDVNITTVGVNLPDDERVNPNAGDEDDADGGDT